MKQAVLSLSGGMDSSTLLLHLLNNDSHQNLVLVALSPSSSQVKEQALKVSSSLRGVRLLKE